MQVVEPENYVVRGVVRILTYVAVGVAVLTGVILLASLLGLL